MTTVSSHSIDINAKKSSSKFSWNWGLGILIIIMAIAAASLVLFNQLQEPAQAISADTKTVDISHLTPNDVSDILLRNGVSSNDTPVEVLYAPTWYFDWNNRSLPDKDTPLLAFFVMETIHDGELDLVPPQAFLEINDMQYEALETQVVSDAPHHRVTRVLFKAVDRNGNFLVTNDNEELTLVMPLDGVISSSNTFVWELPLPYDLGILNSNSAVAQRPNNVLTWAAFLAIMGGMLSALSPCLLQLAVYYGAVLASSGAEAGTHEEQIAISRSRLMKTSLFFVVGFTIVYTAGGYVAGYIGQSLENLNGIEQWYRPVSFVSGVIIILFAFRVAIQAKAPLVCRMPMRIDQGSGWASSSMMGLSFAIGCTSCFSATVLSALLLYVGSIGSPVIGALILFLFSSGVGLIFILAAWILGRTTERLTGWLYRYQPIIGGVSALIMALFGILMITYEFHTVSGALYEVFSIGA